QVQGRGMSRHFTGMAPVRLALPGPPRPFDRMLCFVRNPLPLLGPAGGAPEADQVVRTSLSGLAWLQQVAIPFLLAQIDPAALTAGPVAAAPSGASGTQTAAAWGVASHQMATAMSGTGTISSRLTAMA